MVSGLTARNASRDSPSDTVISSAFLLGRLGVVFLAGRIRMSLLAALQKEARKLTKVKADAERQLNALTAAVKAFGSTLVAESANGRKKRGRRKGHKMSAASRRAIAEGQRLRWAKQKKEKAIQSRLAYWRLHNNHRFY